MIGQRTQVRYVAGHLPHRQRIGRPAGAAPGGDLVEEIMDAAACGLDRIGQVVAVVMNAAHPNHAYPVVTHSPISCGHAAASKSSFKATLRPTVTMVSFLSPWVSIKTSSSSMPLQAPRPRLFQPHTMATPPSLST